MLGKIHPSRFARSKLLLLMLFMILGSAHAQSGTQVSAGVLLESRSGLVFMMRPGGGIEAIDIGTGSVRWSIDIADRPLMLTGSRLLAQVDTQQPGVLDLAFINAATGALEGSRRISLPDGVTASVDDGLGVKFAFDALDPVNPSQLVWRYSKRVIQGMPTENPPPVTRFAGIIDVDMAAGNALATGVQPPDINLPRIEQRVLDVAIGRQFLASDGVHVLASERIDNVMHPKPYAWRIHERDGTFIGETRTPLSYAPFAVTGDILMYIVPTIVRREGDRFIENPLTLRAIDLATGQPVWDRALRDTVYMGPYPV